MDGSALPQGVAVSSSVADNIVVLPLAGGSDSKWLSPEAAKVSSNHCGGFHPCGLEGGLATVCGGLLVDPVSCLLSLRSLILCAVCLPVAVRLRGSSMSVSVWCQLGSG